MYVYEPLDLASMLRQEMQDLQGQMVAFDPEILQEEEVEREARLAEVPMCGFFPVISPLYHTKAFTKSTGKTTGHGKHRHGG